jgi:Tol biopolymer transport system component
MAVNLPTGQWPRNPVSRKAFGMGLVIGLISIVMIALAVYPVHTRPVLPGEYVGREMERLPIDLKYIWYPSFNKQGDKIVFEGYDGSDQYVRIFIWDIENGSLSKLPIPGNCKYPRFSNGGGSIVYSSDVFGTTVNVRSGDITVAQKTRNLWIYEMDSDESRQLTFCGYVYPQFASFSEDDREIFFSTELLTDPDLPSHLYSIGADGSNLTRITSGTAKDWDPIPVDDGRLLFMSAEKGATYFHLYTFDLHTGEKNKVLQMDGYYPGIDNKQDIVFQSGTNTRVVNIYMYDLMDMKLYRLTNSEMIFTCPGIDPSGTMIVMCGKSAIDEPYHLYIIDL